MDGLERAFDWVDSSVLGAIVVGVSLVIVFGWRVVGLMLSYVEPRVRVCLGPSDVALDVQRTVVQDYRQS